jgi:hypothetical protein
MNDGFGDGLPDKSEDRGRTEIAPQRPLKGPSDVTPDGVHRRNKTNLQWFQDGCNFCRGKSLGLRLSSKELPKRLMITMR